MSEARFPLGFEAASEHHLTLSQELMAAITGLKLANDENVFSFRSI